MIFFMGEWKSQWVNFECPAVWDIPWKQLTGYTMESTHIFLTESRALKRVLHDWWEGEDEESTIEDSQEVLEEWDSHWEAYPWATGKASFMDPPHLPQQAPLAHHISVHFVIDSLCGFATAVARTSSSQTLLDPCLVLAESRLGSMGMKETWTVAPPSGKQKTISGASLVFCVISQRRNTSFEFCHKRKQAVWSSYIHIRSETISAST